MIPYLWKEWRDHRGLLVGGAVLVPFAVLGALLLIDQAVAPVVGAGVGLAAAALAFASDLVPGEARRGTLTFLRRLPRGLGPAFVAKAAVLVAACAAYAALGFGAAALAQRTLGHPAAGMDWTYAPEACALGLWIFAVAMWLPRGELAVPATIVCLGLLLLPAYLVLAANPGLEPSRAATGIFRWSLAPGALLVAWLSFVRGRRFGGAWGSAWRGLLATVLLFTPAWGYVVHEAGEWRHFDPADPRCRFGTAFLGEGGRHVFANARCGGPNHAVIVDVETGEWRTVGAPRDHFWPVRGAASYPVVALIEEAMRDDRGVWQHYYDGATAEEFKSGWSHMRHDEVERRLARPTTHDGSYAFARGGALILVRGGVEEQVFPR